MILSTLPGKRELTFNGAELLGTTVLLHSLSVHTLNAAWRRDEHEAPVLSIRVWGPWTAPTAAGDLRGEQPVTPGPDHVLPLAHVSPVATVSAPLPFGAGTGPAVAQVQVETHAHDLG